MNNFDCIRLVIRNFEISEKDSSTVFSYMTNFKESLNWYFENNFFSLILASYVFIYNNNKLIAGCNDRRWLPSHRPERGK